MHTCIESLCCPCETDIVLYVHYIAIIIIKKKHKKEVAAPSWSSTFSYLRIWGITSDYWSDTFILASLPEILQGLNQASLILQISTQTIFHQGRLWRSLGFGWVSSVMYCHKIAFFQTFISFIMMRMIRRLLSVSPQDGNLHEKKDSLFLLPLIFSTCRVPDK